MSVQLAQSLLMLAIATSMVLAGLKMRRLERPPLPRRRQRRYRLRWR